MAEHDLTILAIDTATYVCSVAVFVGERLTGESLLHGQKNHSENLLPLIHNLFEHTLISPEQIDLIAVATGPGSFTGLRVGISTAQGLAMALAKDLIGVSSLAVLAAQASLYCGYIAPMIGARRHQVYTCLYRCSAGGVLEKIIGETVIEPALWLEQIPEKVLFIGDGAYAYRDHIENTTKQHLIGSGSCLVPRASSLAYIARKQYLQQGKNKIEEIAPLYIRPPDAELNADICKGSFNPVK